MFVNVLPTTNTAFLDYHKVCICVREIRFFLLLHTTLLCSYRNMVLLSLAVTHTDANFNNIGDDCAKDIFGQKSCMQSKLGMRQRIFLRSLLLMVVHI